MNTIGIFDEVNSNIEEIKELKPLMEYALKQEKLENVEFNIIIVDNNYIKKINKDYRGIDKETDVISFALEDNKEFDFENFRLLGDIYISIDKVYEQAKEYGHSVLRELSFLALHGLLHLLGYDHIKKEDEKKNVFSSGGYIKWLWYQ